MQRTSLVMLVGMLAALGVETAVAKECHGINFPEQVQVQASPLMLNGLGLRQATMLKVNVLID